MGADEQAELQPAPFHEYAWVAKQPLGPTRVSVLFHLASARNFRTGQCNPSAKTIGKRIGTSERNVRYALDDLEALGLIGRRRSRYSFDFTLHFDREVTPSEVSKLPPHGTRAAESAGVQDRQDLPVSDSRAAEIDIPERQILPTNPLLISNNNSPQPPDAGGLVDDAADAQEDTPMDHHFDDADLPPDELARMERAAAIEAEPDPEEDPDAPVIPVYTGSSPKVTRPPTKLKGPFPECHERSKRVFDFVAAQYIRAGMISEVTTKMRDTCLKALDGCSLTEADLMRTYSLLGHLSAKQLAGRSVRNIERICTPDGRNALAQMRADVEAQVAPFDLSTLGPNDLFRKAEGFQWSAVMPMSELGLTERFDEHREAYSVVTKHLQCRRSLSHFRRLYEAAVATGKRPYPADLPPMAMKAVAEAREEHAREQSRAKQSNGVTHV